MERVVFTQQMKDDGYKILIPSMLPIHFKMLKEIFKAYGYNVEVLDDSNEALIIETGLKYVHNDMCYPALLVIGQMISALESGQYDINKVALIITQTGGGCRASNYIFLLRKALAAAGFSQVPVISLNLAGLEDNPGFKITTNMLLRCVYIFLYGDLLQWLHNQTKPYEKVAGSSDSLCDKWCNKINDYCKNGGYRNVKKISKAIIQDFENLALNPVKKPRVGIVGEIYMKYAPLGNHHLEDFLMENGCEPVLSGVMDFMMYCFKNVEYDHELYNRSKKAARISHLGYSVIYHYQKVINKLIEKYSHFHKMDDFEDVIKDGSDILQNGVKMGEGWLLTHEMVALINHGVDNIVCCQPFGCLPNHIIAKGMNKKIKEKYNNANIIYVDFDPSASHVNQENRIKMMIANIID